MAGVCRTCMNESKMYLPIFDEIFVDVMFFEILNDMCQLDITMGDKLPEYLCHNCCSKVLEFQKFKVRAHEVRASLQSLKEHGRCLELGIPCGSSLSEIERSEVTVKQETPYEDVTNEIKFEPGEFVAEESDDFLLATDSVDDAIFHEKYKTELFLNESDSEGDVIILKNYPIEVSKLPVSMKVGDVLESEEANEKEETNRVIGSSLNVANGTKLFRKEVLEENLAGTEYGPNNRTVEDVTKSSLHENEEEVDVISWTVEDNVETLIPTSLFVAPMSSKKKKTVSDYITLPIISTSGDGHQLTIEPSNVEHAENSTSFVRFDEEVDKLNKVELNVEKDREEYDTYEISREPLYHQRQHSNISTSGHKVNSMGSKRLTSKDHSAPRKQSCMGHRPKRKLRQIKDKDFVYSVIEIPPLKRYTHNFLEKQRRMDLKIYFENLKVLVPALSRRVNISKALILQEASKFCLKLVEQENEQLESVRILKAKQLNLMAKILQLQRNL